MIQEWKKSLAHEHRDRVSIISSHKVQKGAFKRIARGGKCNISRALRGSHSRCLGNVYLTTTRRLWKRYKNPRPDKRSAFLFVSFSLSRLANCRLLKTVLFRTMSKITGARQGETERGQQWSKRLPKDSPWAYPGLLNLRSEQFPPRNARGNHRVALDASFAKNISFE